MVDPHDTGKDHSRLHFRTLIKDGVPSKYPIHVPAHRTNRFVVHLPFSTVVLTLQQCDDKMGQPSFQASNAIIYLTYGAFLYVDDDMKSPPCLKLMRNTRVIGLLIAWHWRKQSKSEFLAANRTQTGRHNVEDKCCALRPYITLRSDRL